MRQERIFLLTALVLMACGEKDTEETTDTGTAEDTAVIEETGDTEETDTEDTGDTGDTEDTDTEETDTDDTDTDDTDTDDTDTDEPDPLTIDDDGDGFSENDGDCDDTDASFSPDAPDDENDGLDQNCDGVADDGYVPTNGAVTVDMLQPGDLVITEVMQNPCTFDLNANSGSGGCSLDDSVGEWFEIYNNTTTEIDLDGLMVTDEPGSNQDSFTVSGQLLIPAGGYLVFGLSADLSINGGVTVNYEYTDMNLGNSSDELMLHSSTDILDSIEWDNGSTFPDPTGASMNLDPGSLNTTDNDDGANWCEAITSIAVTIATIESDLGTPGMANDVCPPPAPPALSYAADILPLFSNSGPPSCVNCHSYLGSQTSLMGTSSGQSSLPLVTAGDSSQSYLYHKVAGTHSSVGGSGSQMPKNQPAFSASDITLVQQWIDDGANP